MIEETLKIPSKLDRLKKAVDFVEELLLEKDLQKEIRDDITISVSEAVTNAITHGNQKDEEKQVKIDITINENKVTVKVHDVGEGFNPEDLPDPSEQENLMKPDGRGIFIVKSLMDKVNFNVKASGTTVTMIKHI